MTVFYDILDTLKTNLEADTFVNTVNFGGIDDVLLQKQDIYPYSHILLNSATYDGALIRFNFSVITMDIVDVSNDSVTDIFIGNDNLHDVLNTQLAVQTRLLEVLRRGDDHWTYNFDGTADLEHFTDRFEHGVAGWTSTFDLVAKHGMTKC